MGVNRSISGRFCLLLRWCLSVDVRAEMARTGVAVQVGGSHAEHQVAGAGSQGRHADPRGTGQASHGRRHEGRRGFVSGQDEPDARPFQCVHQFKYFTTGMPESESDAGFVKGPRDDLRAGVIWG